MRFLRRQRLHSALTILVPLVLWSGQGAADDMKIQFVIGETTLRATIEDNSASRDFLKQLPLEVELEDYAGIEKIFYPPQKLATTDTSDGIDPDPGDITYYAPWGDVAIFYRDFGYSRGLVRLGRFEAGAVAQLSKLDKGPVRIEIAE